MAHMTDTDWEDGTWDCSCGQENQELEGSFWEWDEATCSGCGAAFDLMLDGGTEEGFYYLPEERAE